MENVLLAIGGWRTFFAGFSILSFLSFVQWSLTTASINAFWIRKPKSLSHSTNIQANAAKVFAHFSVHVCSSWSLIILVDANYFQTSFWLKNSSHSLGICCFQLFLLSFSGKENAYCLASFSVLKLVLWICLLVCVTEAFMWRPKHCESEAAGQDGHLLWCKVK